MENDFKQKKPEKNCDKLKNEPHKNEQMKRKKQYWKRNNTRKLPVQKIVKQNTKILGITETKKEEKGCKIHKKY